MASITSRNLDDDVKTRLRVRAADNGRSMEEEARLILRDVVGRKPSSRNLTSIIRSHFRARQRRGPGAAAARARARAAVLRLEPAAMTVLLDTNVVSELMRRAPHPAVPVWAAGHPLEDLFFSAVGEAELRDGAAILPTGRRRRLWSRISRGCSTRLSRIGCCRSTAARRARTRTSPPCAVPSAAPSDRPTARSQQSLARATWRSRRAMFGTSRTSTSRWSILGRWHDGDAAPEEGTVDRRVSGVRAACCGLLRQAAAGRQDWERASATIARICSFTPSQNRGLSG